MAEESSDGNQPHRISKHWMNLYSEKISKSGKKVNERFLKWSTSQDKPLISSGIGSGQKKRNAEDVIDEYLARYKIRLTSPNALKLKKKLPFSDAEINVYYNQGDVKLTAKKINFPHHSVLDTFSDIVTNIETLREDKQQTASELTYHQAEFFCHATQFVSFFAQQFETIKTGLDRSRDASSLEIDRDFLRLAMSLETLHPHYVAQEMYSFVENFVQLAYRLKSIFHSLSVSNVNINSDMEQLCNGALELRNALVHAKNTPLSPNNMSSGINELETPAVALRNFNEVIQTTNIGISFCSGLPTSAQILRTRFGFKDAQIIQTSDEYGVLESWLYQFYQHSFHLLRQGISSTNVPHEEEFHQSFPMNLLKVLLSETGYTVPRYTGIERRAQHLMSTVSKAEHKKSIEGILSKTGSCKQALSAKGFEAMPGLVQCLRDSPRSFDEKLNEMELEYDAEAKWKQQIRSFEVEVDNTISDEEGLQVLLSGLGMNVTTIHETLERTMFDFVKANQDYHRIRNNMRTTNSLIKATITKKRKNLDTAKNDFSKKYIDEKKKLLETIGALDLEKNMEKGIEKLKSFDALLITALESFKEGLWEADIDQTGNAAGAAGALMIGLGEAGEHIVRAALAKMLNNRNDSRCRNLLNGLGVDVAAADRALSEKGKTFEFTVPEGEKAEDYAELTGIFDQANLLAINAGPEQKTMLAQPYNYIWGTQGASGSNMTSTINPHYHQWATNCVLVDINKDGSGGKMGKGRAYAVRGESGIKDALRSKREQKNIRQVCIVHSFAGGSGSGMILPILRMVKQVMPAAMVWVFSAGETQNGKSTHDAENVVYITSDILQARYNALHHQEYDIMLDEWREYKNTGSRLLTDLNESWNEILPHLQADELNDSKDYDERRRGALKEIESIHREVKATYDWFHAVDCADIGEDSNKEQTESRTSPFDRIVKDQVEQNSFKRAAQNPKTATRLGDIWELLARCKQDKGSYMLERLVQKETDSKQKSVQETGNIDFDTRYKHIKHIVNGIRSRIGPKEELSVDEALKEITENHQDRKEFLKYLRFGCNSTINTNIENSTISDLTELANKLTAYGSKMEKYHSHITDHYELIKLNLMVTDDPNIKHVIVSNAHLDGAATEIVGNRVQNYEIYNSIMVDTFLNLVHSILENPDSEEEDFAEIITLSSEAMDKNDMAGRTYPTSNATILSLPEALTPENDIQFSRDDKRNIEGNDPVYALFKRLFEDPSSPLVNENLDVKNLEYPGIALVALYSNYLRAPLGLRKYKPHEVIESLEETDMSTLFPNTERIEKFYKNHFETLSPTQVETMEMKHRFGQDEFQNMVQWIGLLGPSLVSRIYPVDSIESFVSQTTDWDERWKKMFGDESANDKLTESYRRTELKSMTRHLYSLAAEDQNLMATFLFNMNIVDSSHLAAIPSAFVYDFAPLILNQIIEPKIEVTYLDSGGKKLSETTLTEEQAKGFINPNQLPTLDVVKSAEYSAWGEFKKQLQNKDINLAFNIFHDAANAPCSYLRISPWQEGRQQNNVYDITPKFMNDFATLKHAQLTKYPEFGSTTFLNKLIIASADVKSSSLRRQISEKPKFRNAHEDIRINSLPRHLHSDETDSSILLRTMLLGNVAELGTRTDSLQKANLRKYYDKKWFKDVQGVKSQDYGEAFDPNQFDICLKQRLKKFADVFEFDSDNATDEKIPEVVLHIIKLKINDVRGDFDDDTSKAVFDKLFEAVKLSETANYIEDLPGDVNKDTMRANLADVGNLLSRLSSLCFDAHRQFKFISKPNTKEFGVAFEFEGTLDATRSMPENWLWLINSSTSIKARTLERTLLYYSEEYLNSPQEPTYKVFVQNLSNGPLCHMTLVNQRSAFTEVSDKFRQLMKKLRSKKWGAIKAPYVHPYSFLRNILWLHTFKNTWTSNPNKTFSDALKIDADIIKEFYSQPEMIDRTEEAVISSGDMKGIDLSRYDTELWRIAKNDVYHQIDGGQDEGRYSRRMRSPVHIIDMLLINYFLEVAKEEGKSFTEAFNDEADPIRESYPVDYWKARLDKLDLTAMRAEEMEGDVSDGVSLPGLDVPENTIPGLPGGSQNHSEGEYSKIWKEAIEAWVKWYGHGNNESKNQNLTSQHQLVE